MNTRLLCRATIAAQFLFVAAFLVAGAAEGHGYHPLRHDISDLGALTAHHAGLFRLVVALSGLVTIVFGLLVVRPLLRSTAAGVLVALSLPGLDNLTDAFFRLDCRAADAGCSASVALSSWHAKLHIVCFVIAALATIAAPFVIARRLPGPDRRRAVILGWVTIALLVASGASSGSAVQGLTQRIAATVVPLGVALLAWSLTASSRAWADSPRALAPDTP